MIIRFLKKIRPILVLLILGISVIVGLDSYSYVSGQQDVIAGISAGAENGCLMFLALMAFNSLLEHLIQEAVEQKKEKV